jgi:ferredoxin-like protein FixX
MDIYPCQKRRRPDPLSHNDFNRISILMKESHRGTRFISFRLHSLCPRSIYQHDSKGNMMISQDKERRR